MHEYEVDKGLSRVLVNVGFVSVCGKKVEVIDEQLRTNIYIIYNI